MIKYLLGTAALILLLTSCAKDDAVLPEQHGQKIVIPPSNGNPGTLPVTVELPAGLIGVSRIHDKQNGLSIEKYLITVPPTERYGGGRDTTTVYIGMACLNKNRSMPWYDNIGPEQVFPISRNNYPKFIVSTDPNLRKLLELLQGHPGLKVNAHWDPVAAHEEDYVVPEWMKIHKRSRTLSGMSPTVLG
ncbi:hypothetical protein [Sphingobacterium thalpophilum]|uniref:Uncharacterized protein n=1 Tax=Sphingobacterium thalpophilum TaxID=259 RepID=A0A4U9UWR6_9SPHI|nr:hypothetical protein [Sphingobacterium thalpophilum]VTR34604.1 Uncharacterised protein [Sphingobacterium thalpophilum]